MLFRGSPGMTSRLLWVWSRLNANYWFYPALFAVGGAMLAMGMVYLDRQGVAAGFTSASGIVPARPDGASNMLTVIAGSMIGVASTVFSITIAAVAYASGNYGPRLLTNFMEDKGNQLSLASFIGTFTYSLTVLRTVRAADETGPLLIVDGGASALPGFVPQLSLLVAYGLMALSVAVLVFFLNHIPSSIRINTVLEGIGRRLLDDVIAIYPRDCQGGEPAGPPPGERWSGKRTGYVQRIDFSGLQDLAKKEDCEFALEVRTGDFVHPGVAFLRICGTPVKPGEEWDAKLSELFTLGATRTPEQDPQFLIDELVEIALRALSPGINDPFTAITAIHWLGAATAELGRRDLNKRVGNDEEDGRQVHPLPDDFAHFLHRGFGAARGALATSKIACLIALDALRNVSAAIDDESRQILLQREGRMLMSQAELALSGPELDEVRARFARFEPGAAITTG